MLKSLILSLALIFTVTPLFGQTKTVQLGTARELNSGRKTLGKVYIKYEASTPATSDVNGVFQLEFQNKKAGQYVFLSEVRKAGYELVNKKELDQVKVSNSDTFGVDVILALAGTVDAAKKVYYEVSDSALVASFKRDKRALRTKLSAAALKQAEYDLKLAKLEEDFTTQKNSLDALAEKFARVNFDDVTPIYALALNLFKEGKVDEAIAALEGVDPAGRTRKIIDEQKRLVGAQDDLNRQKEELEKEKQQQIANLTLLADMYGVKFDRDKAAAQYDDLLQLDSTNLSLLREAAEFYQQQHFYQRAINVNQHVISHPEAEQWHKANAQGSLGELYMNIGDLPKALIAYNGFSSSYDALLMLDPQSVFYKNNLAISYSKLGETHTALGNLDTALRYYEERRRIGEELYSAYPTNVNFKNGLAISYEKLGSTHTALGNLDTALRHYEDETELFKELYSAYPTNVNFKNGLAISYVKLGSINFSLSQQDKGLEYFKSARKLLKELTEEAPSVPMFQRYFSIIDDAIREIEQPEIVPEANSPDTLQLYQSHEQKTAGLRVAVRDNPSLQPDLSQSLNSQAWYALLLAKFSAAEELIREALVLNTENKFLHTNLAPALLLQGKFDAAIKQYKYWKDKPFEEQGLATYREAFLGDLKAFEQAGIIPQERVNDVIAVRKILGD
jgi:tetratricopeptide (TPR) repeat protein